MSYRTGRLNFYGISLEKGEVKLYSDAISNEVKEYISSKGCIRHPVNTEILANMALADPTHRACIDIKTTMTVGLGYKFLNKEANTNKQFRKFIEQPNENMFRTFQDLINSLALDYFIFENGYFEIKKYKDMYAIYHLNAKDTYVIPKKYKNEIIPGMADGYCLIKKRGIPINFNSISRYEDIVDTKSYVAHLYNYSPLSDYYGIPSYLSIAPNISENVLIRKHGIKFFENSARPESALLISNGDVTDEEIEKIRTQLTEHKGLENAHRFFIFSVEGENSKVELKEISKSIDGQFLKENEKNRDEIARIHRIPPKILGISSAGSLGSGSETIGALKNFVETFVNPEKKRFENFINMILMKMFGFNPEIQFKQIDLTNKKDDAIIATMLSKIIDINGKPAITVDEIRENIGMPIEIKGAKMSLESSKSKVKNDGKPKVGVKIDQQDKIETLDEKQPNPKED